MKNNKYIYILIVFVGLVLCFFFNSYKVLKSVNERGALAYVQLVNIGMPIAEVQSYDESIYSENKASLKNIFLKSINLYEINYGNILENELTVLSVYKNSDSSLVLNGYNSYVLNDENISKYNTGEDIFDESLKKQLDESKPEVLIYHTHTHENYSMEQTESTNQETNVVGAGEALKNELEQKYGISVIHDKTDNCISYNECYARSRETVTNDLNRYGTFKLIIDLHRDSAEDRSDTTTEINGVSTARIMLVTAKNSDLYEDNSKMAQKIMDKTSELFPTLPRRILVYNRGINAFNLDKSKNSIILELGSISNDKDEAANGAKCMARVIAEVLNEK